MTTKGVSIGIVATALVLGQPAAAQTVIDGDTIELKGTTFRLHGIDAPELRQICADDWPAGRAARYITQEDAAMSARRGVRGHARIAPWQWRRGQG